MKLSLLVFLSTLVTLHSYGQTAPGSSALIAIQDLRHIGIEKIGDFDLDKFQKDAGEITWIFQDELLVTEKKRRTERVYFLAQKNGQQVLAYEDRPVKSENDNVPTERKSGHYDVEKKQIHLSIKSISGSSSEQISQLELHEAMGALGYNDSAYALSTALQILRKANPQDQKNLLDSYGKSLFKKENLQSIGGSSVGGGGDVVALEVKNRFLTSLLQSNSSLSMDFMTKFPQIDFEPFYEKSQQFVGLEYALLFKNAYTNTKNFEGVRRDEDFQEKFIIHFPALTWARSNVDQEIVLQKIRDLILGVFIASDKTATYSFTPDGCPSSVKVAYPSNPVDGIETIQYLRAWLLVDCAGQTKDSMPIQGISIKIPSNANWEL